MKQLKGLFGVILAIGLVFVGCTEPPPLPPGTETKPPGDIKLPGDTGTPPETLKLKGRTTLPRQALAVFVDGDTSYACTPEGSLYKKKIEDIKSFQLTAVDLASGEQRWSHKGSACLFRASGGSLYVVRDLSLSQEELVIDRLDAATGKSQGVLKIAHDGCTSVPKSGPGEPIFSASSGETHACFDFSVNDGKLLFRNQRAVQWLDVASGKVLWQHAIPQESGRIVTAMAHQDVMYVVEGVQQLAEGAIAPAVRVSQKGLYTFQLRAIATATQETKWVVGPLPEALLQARLTVKDESLIVQTMSALWTPTEKGVDALSLLGKRKVAGYVDVYLFALASGESLWKAPLTTLASTEKDEPLSTLVAPLFLADGWLLQSPGVLSMISPLKGSQLWKLPTQDTQISHLHMLSSSLLHMRSSKSIVTLIKLIPKATPQVTRGGDLGSLLYAADGLAPDANGEPSPAAAQGPKRRFSVKGYCVKFDGEPVPMESIQSQTRFFLPPANHYYTPDTFFSAFCANYLLDVEAYEMDGANDARAWVSRALVSEAPVFFYVRNQTLYVLSDNGDWFLFALQ